MLVGYSEVVVGHHIIVKTNECTCNAYGKWTASNLGRVDICRTARRLTLVRIPMAIGGEGAPNIS